MATRGDRDANAIERSRRAFREVEQRVMSRVQLAPAGVRALHRQCDPMLECEGFTHERAESQREFRRRVKEKRPAGLDDSRAFVDPCFTPLEILSARNVVIKPVLVILAKIEWRICEHGINNFGSHVRQDAQAVGLKERSVGGCQKWFHRCPTFYEGGAVFYRFRWRSVNHAAVAPASVNNLPSDPAESVKPASTAGVVPRVMCSRQQLHHAKCKPSIAL